MSKLKDRIALVTGASRGIGYYAALEFAKQGAHIIALARTEGGLEELDDAIKEAGGSATLVPVDLTDFDALDRLGSTIYERWGRLDIFLANAGTLGSLSPLAHFTPKEFANVIDVNITANWRLIRSLDALLKQSDAGRAIFLSSGAARTAGAFWGPYAMSKAALEAMAKSWAAENENTPLNINIVDPGVLRTAMRARAMPGEDPKTLPHPETIAPTLVELASPSCDKNGGYYLCKEKRWA